MIIHALGSHGSYIHIIHEMPAALVNQLMACFWMDRGLELESPETRQREERELEERIASLKGRKIKFDF